MYIYTHTYTYTYIYIHIILPPSLAHAPRPSLLLPPRDNYLRWLVSSPVFSVLLLDRGPNKRDAPSVCIRAMALVSFECGPPT